MTQRWLDFSAIGTTWRVETEDALPPALADAVLERVEAFDATWSRFRGDSLVSGLRHAPGTTVFPEDAVELLGLFRRLYDATHGAVTPLVGAALEHLGYDASYSLRRSPGTVPAVPGWDDVLSVEGNVVTTSAPLVLDVGAVGKGFLVDQVGGLLEEAGLPSYVVDASGDLLCRGEQVQKIGLEDPTDPSRAVGVVTVADGALCASSTTRRAWGPGLHHVIDPATSESTTGAVATWVTSATCAVADGLATALLLVEPGRLSPHFSFAYARLDADGSAEWSDNLAGGLFV